MLKHDRKIAAKHDACGDGPVIIEEAEGGWRGICCFCWAHTETKENVIDAIDAWSSDQIRAWDDN